MNDTLTWYRHFQYKMRYPTHIVNRLDDGTICPACYKMPQKIFSLDADFQLVRKASSGSSISSPKHHGRFFQDQQEVDDYINSYSSTADAKTVECNNFQAGSKLRSKIKTSKIDETAVSGSACRHEVPICFLNLRHGERLSYAVYVIEKLMQKNPEEKIHVMYDIACMLHSHLKKNGRQDILERVSFSIPVFHNYGHKMLCQIVYNPRRTEGVGLTDGECMERLWSSLGRFSQITKEMTPENKTDLLVDGLINYAFRVKAKLGEVLVGKHNKAQKLEETTQRLLEETIHELNGVSEETVEDWVVEENVQIHNRSDIQQLDTGSSWEELHAGKLQSFYDLRMKIESVNSEERGCIEKKIQSLDKQLAVTERKYGIMRWDPSHPRFQRNIKILEQKQVVSHLNALYSLISERNFMLNLLKKYARGQSVAIRLSRQLKRINKNINKSIKTYNDWNYKKELYPEQIHFNHVKLPDFWTFLDRSAENNLCVPLSVKSDCIIMKETIKRFKEERNFSVPRDEKLSLVLQRPTFLIN